MPSAANPSSDKKTIVTKHSLLLQSDVTHLDPELVSLFSNPNPTQTQRKTSSRATSTILVKGNSEEQPSTLFRQLKPPSNEVNDLDSSYIEPLNTSSDQYHARNIGTIQRNRKRKRQDHSDDFEGKYLQRLIEDEARENSRRRTELHDEPNEFNELYVAGNSTTSHGVNPDENTDASTKNENADSDSEVPMHESLLGSHEAGNIERSERTVFLSNVSSSAIVSKADKKALLRHLNSVTSSLPTDESPHNIESLRFRSIAFSSSLPKKAAFVKRELMDTTTKSTNAYVVYSTILAAQEAVNRLNGTVILGRHLRVDLVAHPAKIDNRRCVFVGNLGYVDDESQVIASKQGNDKRPPKTKPPGDVEEGLWRQFGNAGTVESVRVVRDPKTRVGKGFAYVQFRDENAVEAALLYNDKKFPPLLPRKLRVIRAKRITQNTQGRGAKPAYPGNKGSRAVGVHQKAPRDAQDRNVDLLGRAGAAKIRSIGRSKFSTGSHGDKIKMPEHLVFEGHRASSKQGNKGLRLGGLARKKKGKPRTRSAKRGALWKTKGGEKSAK